ncbi:AGE family epimerase/isomerase [Sphingobacterium griseoflavum]|uniref:Cellobiose 2-epimerase n=1 Tax=Sphingobacterium griseoflavum TaxID=1474952 RepID=A0ABQ3I1H8_9SPHI|nr:AGE family epimerase/isomerase [Sphingobacterium griseoflavum]GHE44736.1 cellobiose 2-epimerase [Sphingobacterium griseoflavum]
MDFKDILEGNILRFWSEKMVDREFGGFYGRIDGNGTLVRDSNKGVVMHARILWTFSAAYRILKQDRYLQLAKRAYGYIKDYFLDKEFGGVFWELDYRGNPVNTKKQTYALGFVLYGFSEFYRATGIAESLQLSKEMFWCIEKTFDREGDGYWEAFSRDWSPIGDMRLSEKDENQVKTMNTHLHILEPYSNLLRIWKDDKLLAAQKNLIDIFVKKIFIPKTGHLALFFDKTWNVVGNTISYGHDIEAAWLLWEAAVLVSDADLLTDLKPIVQAIGEASLEGVMANGAIAYEFKDGHRDEECHWWVQAEAIVGFSHLDLLHPERSYGAIAQGLWKFTQEKLIDYKSGEWYWSVWPNGIVNRKEDKAGFWKCPYHNSRMCFELMALNKNLSD